MLPPTREVYNHLRTIGTLPIKIILPTERDIGRRHDDKLLDYLTDDIREELILKAGSYFMSYGDQPTVDASIRKMDFAPTRLYMLDENEVDWNFAENLFTSFYTPIFNDATRISTPEEILEHLHLDKASGLPWSWLGYKTKEDFFASPYTLDLFKSVEYMGTPLWKVVPKTEWYPLEKLVQGKVRTFIIPPVHLVYWLEAFFKTQNDALKGAPWSAYGFNPYQGGTNLLAQSLIKHKDWIILTYDVSGWDRKLPLMRYLYDFRSSFYDEGDELLKWCCDNVCESLLVLPDGSVVLKKNGNNSGNVGTTQDNIMAHVLILSYALSRVHGRNLTLVLKIIVKLFGDDAVLAMPIPKMQNWKNIFEDSYKHFGLSLDPFIVSQNIEDHTFLGFRFKRYGNYYLPEYPIDRLIASFTYSITTGSTYSQCLSKAFSLLVMSAPHAEFSLLCSAYSQYLQVLKAEDDPVIQGFVFHGPPNRQDCINWMLGHETSSSFGGWMEQIELYNVKCKDKHYERQESRQSY